MAKPPKWQSWFIVFVLVQFGLMAGVQYNRLSTAGYFIRWEKLGAPPSHSEVELIGISWNSVDVKYGEDIYGCSIRESNCQPYEDLFDCNFSESVCPPSSDIFSKSVTNCDRESIAFDSRAKPPENIASCVYEYVYTNDGFADSFAVIDDEGNLWLWQNTILLFMREVGLAIMPTFGILAGLTLGLAINLYRRYVRPFLKRRKSASHLPNNMLLFLLLMGEIR